MENNKIYITNDDGVEFEMNIRFTFDANGKNYAIVYNGNNEDELYALTYDEDNNLYAVEDEEELEMIEEVIAAFDGEGEEDEEGE